MNFRGTIQPLAEDNLIRLFEEPTNAPTWEAHLKSFHIEESDGHRRGKEKKNMERCKYKQILLSPPHLSPL